MNGAVWDIQQYKQQSVWPAHRAPHRLMGIVLAIAAFFAVEPRLDVAAPVNVATFVTPGEMRAELRIPFGLALCIASLLPLMLRWRQCMVGAPAR